MTNDPFPMTKEFNSPSRSDRVEIKATCSLRHWSLVIASFLLAAAFSLQAAVDPGASSLSRFGGLPLYFEANAGQTDPSVGYVARGKGHTIYLHTDGASIVLHEQAGARNAARAARAAMTNEATVRVIRMTIEGANPQAVAGGLEPLAGRVNYLVGNDPSRWRSGVTTFARVQYTGVAEGVDVIYYGKDQELEYDFALAAGVDPSSIRLRFDGAEKIEIDAEGNLLLRAGAGELRQHRPVAYQMVEGKRREVRARYQLLGERRVGFAVGAHDRALPLVIDPILSYSTYLGGGNKDVGWAIAVDAEGRAYVAGDTLSVFTKLPTSGEQPLPGGGTRYGGDAFVTRLDFDTNTLALTLGYLTYLGGNGLDAAIGIAVDATGSAYITGYTTSSNFPALPFNVFQPAQAGPIVPGFNSRHSDAFVTKLDTNGEAVYSTYLGGELGETGADIAVDASGAAYVVGYTDSVLTFVITNQLEVFRYTNGIPGAATYKTNVTTASLLAASSSLTNTVVSRRATDTNVVQIVTNITLLSSMTDAPVYLGFPVVNAIQTNNHSTTRFIPGFNKRTRVLEFLTNDIVGADLFIAKVAPDGLSLEYATYLGGAEDDFGTGIGVALDGSVSVSGWTTSVDFPATNALQSSIGGVRDAVVAKLNPAGDALVFASYLGGRGSDSAYRLAVDAAGATFVAGATASADFPVTPGALGRGGIFTSTNASAAWSLSAGGLDQATINALLADPFNPGTLYAGTARGVFKSANGGAAWSAVNTGLLSRVVNTLAIEPLTGSEVFAGMSDGLFQSSNGGLLWTNVEPDLGSIDVRAIHFDAATGTNLFAGTSFGVYARVPSTDTNSTEALMWELRNQGLRNRSVRVLRDDGAGGFYAATDGGVYRSTNWGVNWSSLNKGLKSTRVRALVIDPATSTTLYAGTARGVHKLTDGTNWVQLTNGIGRPQVNALLIDPATPAVLYAGTTNGVFRSSDAGASWTLSQSNLSTVNVAVLAFAPGGGDTVYAGTRSTNFFGGTNDAFLVKYSPDGLAYDYALTFGGSRNDEAWDVALDVDGTAYVTGQTASKEFPVRGTFTPTNSYQTNLSGKIDAFVAGFTADGGSNFLSFYHGGSKTDYAHGIALDPQGNAYIVGRTESAGLPVTNRLMTVSDDPLKLGGKRDAFVTKFLLAPPGVSVEPLLIASGGVTGVSHVRVSWPASAYEFRLESREANGGAWMPVAERPTLLNGRYQVTLPASASTLMFRLRM